MENNDVKMVILTELGNEIDAEMVKSYLEDAGIKCNLISNFSSTALITVGEDAIVKVFVPEDKLEEAQELLDSIPENTLLSEDEQPEGDDEK